MSQIFRHPTLAVLATIAGVVWSASFGILRDFVWADLRGGMLRVDGFSRVTRGLVIIGFALLFAMLGVLLTNDGLRDHFPLLELSPPDARRGSMLPLAVVPVTMFMLSLAWGYLLAGGLHSHPALRLLVLFLYLFNHADFTGKIWDDKPLLTLLSWTPLLGLIVFFALRWRTRSNPSLELPVLLGLVSANHLISHVHLADAIRIGTGSLFLSSLNNTILNLTLFVTPLLLLTGMDIADFTQRAGGWVGQIARQRLSHWLLMPLLAAALIFLLRDVERSIVQVWSDVGTARTLLIYAMGAAVPVWCMLIWFAIRRISERRVVEGMTTESVLDVVSRWALPVILGFFSLQFMSFALVTGALLLVAVGVIRLVDAPAAFDAIGTAMRNETLIVSWRLVASGVAVIIGLLCATRRQIELALYLLVFGLVSLRNTLTSPGRLLNGLVPNGAIDPADACWALLVAGLCIRLALRRALSAERCAGLLTLAITLLLIQQSEFIGNRFSPFFSFAGVGFVAFGIFWDAVTIGSWANEDSPGLPRISRVLLYIGYVLLTVTVVNWALALHDLGASARLTGSVALDGFRFIGKPFLYTIFAVVLGPLLLPRQQPSSVS
jgi:hypothetical protein